MSISFPHKSISLGISFHNLSVKDWRDILTRYAGYLHDIYFSPYDNEQIQSRRNVYNFHETTSLERRIQLESVLQIARENDIRLKLVLNSNFYRQYPEEILNTYQSFRQNYHIDYVTTFFSGAQLIRKTFPDARIVCSYNQGIKSHVEMREILDSNIFDVYVLGQRFIRDFDIFRLIHSYGKQVELLVNNGCMHTCISYCSIPGYCWPNFDQSHHANGYHALYAESSLFPEELALFYFDSGDVDIYKLSCRPIQKDELYNLLNSYLMMDSQSFTEKDCSNYHLYARLTHFSPFYSKFCYNDILYFKRKIWDNLGFDAITQAHKKHIYINH